MQFPELKYDFAFNRIEIADNLSIAYREEGDANSPSLLFIHGLSSYIPAWSKLIPLLKNKFRCIAIDLPGYGKSSGGIFSGTMEFYSNSIAKFIIGLGIEKVTLVGHSMGGHIALKTGLNFPDLVDKLILLAPAGIEIFNEEEINKIIKFNTPEMFFKIGNDQIKSNYALNFYNMPADTEPMIRDRINMKEWKNFFNYCTIVSNSLKGMLEDPVLEKLHLLSRKSLILFGRNDRLIPNQILHKDLSPESIGEAAASLIPDSKLIMIDHCGHFIPFEKEKTVCAEMVDFIG